MQDELSKAEEQEDSLMKLKDLYKEEIKNLIRQNQDQLKLFEEEMKKERQKVEQADSLQRMEALKQIFLKVVSAFLAVETDISKPKKRDERKKELEDYLKVCCNLMNIDPQVRDKILTDVR
jgi:predicted type IV restriction endonuclease